MMRVTALGTGVTRLPRATRPKPSGAAGYWYRSASAGRIRAARSAGARVAPRATA